MELLYIVLTILGVFLLLLVARMLQKKLEQQKWYDNFLKFIGLRKKTLPVPEPTSRMFVVIKRHQAGRGNLLFLDQESLGTYVNSINEQMQELVGEWSTCSKYKWGFHGSDYGLPSNGEDNWQLFASFMVPSYEMYRQCLMILEQDKYISLRNQCDIRLLYGEEMTSLPEFMFELF